jgi:hypothetical protein
MTVVTNPKDPAYDPKKHKHAEIIFKMLIEYMEEYREDIQFNGSKDGYRYFLNATRRRVQ